MFVPTSKGVSKFGLALNVTTPVVALMSNNAASAPARLYVNAAMPPVAVAVYTVPVAFSASVAEPPEVKIGASFTSVTVTDSAWELAKAPSDALTIRL